MNSTVPSGSVVSAVRLKFVLTQTSILSGDVTLSLRRVLADWGEGGSKALPNEGQGAVAATGDATWLHRFYPTQNWTVAGGDVSTTLSASLTVNQVGEYTWNSTPEMVADVQSWVDNPATNFGWMILGDESGPFSAKRFASRENVFESLRPLLTIEFIPPIIPGDADGDGFLTVVDVFYLVNFLFASGPAPAATADANGDTNIDAADVLYLLAYLFGAGPAPV